MAIRPLKQYRQVCNLANLAFRVADQAMHAKNAGEITPEEYHVLLTVFSRVHTSYHVDLNRIEKKILNKKYGERLIDWTLGALFLGLIAAWIFLR